MVRGCPPHHINAIAVTTAIGGLARRGTAFSRVVRLRGAGTEEQDVLPRRNACERTTSDERSQS